MGAGTGLDVHLEAELGELRDGLGDDGHAPLARTGLGGDEESHGAQPRGGMDDRQRQREEDGHRPVERATVPV